MKAPPAILKHKCHYQKVGSRASIFDIFFFAEKLERRGLFNKNNFKSKCCHEPVCSNVSKKRFAYYQIRLNFGRMTGFCFESEKMKI